MISCLREEFKRFASKLYVLEQLFMGTPYSYMCETEKSEPKYHFCYLQKDRRQEWRILSGNEKQISAWLQIFRVIVIFSLHRQNDRNDHRPLGGLLQEEAADFVGDVLLYIIHIDRIHAVGRFFDGVLDEDASFVEEFLGFAQIDKAAADDVGRFAQAAGLAVDDGEDDEDAVLGQCLAVADDHVLDVADREAVHHDDVRRRLFL